MAVKIFGHTVSTPAAVAIAGGSGVAIWFAYKQHKASSASSASSATDPSAIDPVTGLPYSQDNQIDPLTGMTYLAEAQEYGSVSAAEQATAGEASASLSSAGDSGLSDLTGTSTGTSLEAVPGGYASNAAWAQAVTAGLSAIGYTSTDVSAALGLYLGSLPLSTLADGVSSASIVSAALAEYGPPPVGTFTMIAASGTTTAAAGTTSTGTTATTTTPATTTAPAAAAPAPSIGKAYPTPANLHQTVYDNEASLAANVTPNALCHWQVLTAGGANVIDSSATASSSGAFHAEATGLKSKTAYKWRVAVDQSSTNLASAWSGLASFTTT